MVRSLISVETVVHRTQMRRFLEVPYLLFGDDDRWSRGVRAHEQWRFSERRHPFFDRGHAAYFLARRAGRPVGRVTAHLASTGAPDGAFGFLAAPDEPGVTAALITAAAEWLSDEGAEAMTGPLSWTADEEFGVPVAGADHPGVTGRPWHPGYYADHLAAAGLAAGEVRHTYRLDAGAGPIPDPVDVDPPPQAGSYADRSLVLDGIAAVPDVTPVLASTSLRSAWRAARRASRQEFATAVCVSCDGDPAALVPELLAAAAARGYRDVITPWAPPGTAPETTHQVFHRTLP